VIRAREELGGVTQAEQDAARLAAWRTTILALETEAGQVVSVADEDVPAGTGKFRILSWRLNRDYSVDITGKTVTVSMYDMTAGPKPTDVAAAPVPEENSAVWDPAYEQPITNDPLFSAKSFGVRQVYEPDAGGVVRVSVDVFGDPPPDVALQFKARRELVSGIFAQQVASVATIDATHGTIALGGSGLTVNGFVGRVFSKLANPSGSTALLPIQDFTVTANDAVGNFTVTPDPGAAGCAAGDLVTLRTAPTAFDSTSFTDSLFVNFYNSAGLRVGKNRGNLALVIAGTGAGQSPRTVVDNTTTKVTVTPAWSVVPDATSVIVLVEAAARITFSPDFNLGATDHFLGNFPIENYSRMVVRLEGYTSRGAADGRIEKAAFREIFIWGGQGTRRITASTTQLITDGLVEADASGVTQPAATTLAAAVTTTSQTAITLVDGSSTVNGTDLSCGTDRWRILSGGGSNNLVVDRTIAGATPATHSNGAAVAVPGALTFTCLAAEDAPNVKLGLKKTDTSINYVVQLAGGSDTFDNGATAVILPDNTDESGFSYVQFPG
jgi:hypothetical protein